MILHVSGHYALVNSRALDARGIGDDVRDPAGGSFERDEAGRPTGLLRDTATNLVLDHIGIPWRHPDASQLDESMANMMCELADKGYIADTEDAQERVGEAGKDLPTAQEVLELLVDYLESHAPQRYSDEIEDHFSIERIEPGKLWLEPLSNPKAVGPIPVPKKVTQLCQPHWDISGVVARAGKGWRLVEVWNVVP